MAVAAMAIALGWRAAATMDPHHQAFREALSELESALEVNAQRTRQMRRRIAQLRRALDTGRPLHEIVSAEEPPLIVQLLSESIATLHEHSTRTRRTEARALHSEGLTMDQIADLFGVTRQRISALLREPPAG
jgi:hypothetical protein